MQKTLQWSWLLRRPVAGFLPTLQVSFLILYSILFFLDQGDEVYSGVMKYLGVGGGEGRKCAPFSFSGKHAIALFILL